MQRWWWILTASMLLIGAVPWLLAATGVDGGFLFAFLCHQLPERTLHIHGEAMAVCSRCAGVHLGIALGALAAPTGAHAWIDKYGRALVIAAIALNLIDWAWSHWTLSHVSRLTVGAMFGGLATLWMLTALRASGRRTPALSRT